MSRMRHALMLIKPPGSAKLRFVAREERPPNRRTFRRHVEVGEGSAARIHTLNLSRRGAFDRKLSSE